MGDEFYHRQKQVEQDHDRAQHKGSKHTTYETWQLEQQAAEDGKFVPDPMDKLQPTGKKPNLLVRIQRALFGKK
jgi:hypothetical protein